jgi:hypothetical protein
MSSPQVFDRAFGQIMVRATTLRGSDSQPTSSFVLPEHDRPHSSALISNLFARLKMSDAGSTTNSQGLTFLTTFPLRLQRSR